MATMVVATEGGALEQPLRRTEKNNEGVLQVAMGVLEEEREYMGRGAPRQRLKELCEDGGGVVCVVGTNILDFLALNL